MPATLRVPSVHGHIRGALQALARGGHVKERSPDGGLQVGRRANIHRTDVLRAQPKMRSRDATRVWRQRRTPALQLKPETS